MLRSIRSGDSTMSSKVTSERFLNQSFDFLNIYLIWCKNDLIWILNMALYVFLIAEYDAIIHLVLRYMS